MKQHTLQFLDCNTAELWEILPEFTDATVSYQKFVDTVYKLYPGSDAQRRWSIGDMEKLVGEASRVGISLLADLGKYHREFIAMTTFLIAKNCISAAEQSRAFTRGFPQKLWAKIAHRLQLKFPDHFPDDPYTLKQIHKAAQFVLHSTASLSLALDDTRTPAPMMALIAKAEPTELTTLINMMKQAISKLGTPSAPAPQAKPLASAPHGHHCHFCGGDHWKVAVRYSRSMFVTESVYFATMAVSCCLVDISFLAPLPERPLENVSTNGTDSNPVSTSTANALLLDVSPNLTVGVLQLSSEEHILSLEKELFALCARELAPGVQMRAQKAHDPDPPTDALTPAKRPTPAPAPAPVAPAPPPVPAA